MRISDWSSDVCSSDLFRISAAVLQLELHLRRATTARYVTGKQLLAQAQHIGARLLDVHEDRIQPLDRGERVGLRSGDERADGVCRATDAAGEIGRAHVCTPVTNAHLVCRILLATTTII